MGGQNHQPCNRIGTNYLRLSTQLSRALSSARIEMEMANHSLEDVLLNEMDGAVGTLAGVHDRLNASKVHLVEMVSLIQALRSDMNVHNYEDLPTLAMIDLDATGKVFAQQHGLVHQAAWDEVADTMKHNGFYGVLERFEQAIAALLKHTTSLATAVYAAEPAARNGDLEQVLERNEPGNFKVEFAQLYTAWAAFQQFFLASSMLSTELWYRFNNTGSLTQTTTSVSVA